MRRSPRKRAAGFSLVAAIFLLTILAALGAFIVTVSTTQQVSSALDVQGVRAYQAARAGIQWGAYQQLRNGSCASSSFGFTAPTLAAFTVTVQCTAYADGNGGPMVHQITSTACNQPACPNAVPGTGYVERQMQVTF